MGFSVSEIPHERDYANHSGSPLVHRRFFLERLFIDYILRRRQSGGQNALRRRLSVYALRGKWSQKCRPRDESSST